MRCFRDGAASRPRGILKAKTIGANEGSVRRFAEHVGSWPWQWRASDVDEYFEDLLTRPQRLSRSTLRAYQWRLKGFSEYACDRRYPWTVICEREFGRGPGSCLTSATSSRIWTNLRAIHAAGR